MTTLGMAASATFGMRGDDPDGLLTAGSAPSAPTNSAASSVDDDTLNVGYTDNSDDETGFEIEQSPDGSTGWTLIHTTAANVTSYNVTGLANDTTFWFRVRAVNASGDSDYDTIVNATTLPAPSNTVTAAISASRTTGPAPLAVHFDAIGTTHTDGGVDTFRQLGYHFTFDDTGSGTWTHSGKSKNSQIGGPLAAHVFESAGTYTVKVRAQDSLGNNDDTNVVVTVSDPDVTYTTTSTVCISTNTDTTGSPAGAELLTNQSSWPTFASDKRYLLRAGQDFSSFGNISMNYIDDWQVGSFGSGANPITAGIFVHNNNPGSNTEWGVRGAFYDLDATDGGVGISTIGALFLRCDVGGSGDYSIGTTTRWYFDLANPAKQPDYYWPKNIFIVECDITASTSQYCLFALMSYSAVMGCTFANPGQHCTRHPVAYKIFHGHNKLDNPGSAQHQIKYTGSGLDVWADDLSTTTSPRNRYGVIADNITGDADSN